LGHIVTYPFKPIKNLKQNIQVISIADRMRIGQNSVLTAHRTDFYILKIVTQGQSKHMIDFNNIDVTRGSLVIIKPSQVHAFNYEPDYNGWLIAFPKTFFCNSSHDIHFLENAHIFNNLNSFTQLHLRDGELDNIVQLTLKILGELQEEPDTFQWEISHNYLSNILLTAERKYLQENSLVNTNVKLSQENKLVTAYNKLVNKHFRTHTKVKYYATELFVSERTLQKSTMSVLGKSPKELINAQVILESKRLLVHEVMSVKEISYLLGFEEPSNFTKFFKKNTGLSPNQFKVDN